MRSSFLFTGIVVMVSNFVIVFITSILCWNFFTQCSKFLAFHKVSAACVLMLSFFSFHLSIHKTFSFLYLYIHHAYFLFYQMFILQALNTHWAYSHQLLLWTIFQNCFYIYLFTLMNEKIIKNTYCPFDLTIQIYRKQTTSDKTCLIDIEWNHNHPLVSLKVLSSSDIKTTAVTKVITLFEKGSLSGYYSSQFIFLKVFILSKSLYFESHIKFFSVLKIMQSI